MCICSSFKNLISKSKVFFTFYFHSSFCLKFSLHPALTNASCATICSLLVLLCVLFHSTIGWAWERNTHAELTEQTIRITEADLNTYLINNLGLKGGLNASVKGGTPQELMKLGSNKEDDEDRSLNHFHEPINDNGLELPVLGGISAINWSLSGAGDQKWSWNDAREYYFKALTSETKADRDENWGKTFRALGQVMHLLQDSANPSHVRDDPHPFDDGLHDYMERRSVGSYIGSGIFSPDPSMLEQSGATRSEPFSNLFDRNVYSGSNPRATLGTNIGVTEYTNANFFSDDTIPGQGSIFSTEITHPTVAELVSAPVPSPYLTLPRLGSAAFPGARAAKLTGNQAVAKFILTDTNLDLLGQLKLDDAVYEAQAQNLIPRAVGYSAAVLDYFFRGALSVQQPELDNNIVEVCSHPNGDFEPVGTLNVGFTISPSDLSFGGTASLYYDLPGGNRILAEMGQFSPSNTEGALSTTIFLDQLPLFVPVRWMVVLEGQMGPGAQEQPRAIMGKTGLALWNDIGCPI
jgi:hypothetical protein